MVTKGRRYTALSVANSYPKKKTINIWISYWQEKLEFCLQIVKTFRKSLDFACKLKKKISWFKIIHDSIILSSHFTLVC